MLCKFPQILSKLRREKGISQKKAAAELGISPALLSHYENGIRECGLDFLLRLADYYSVSCDFLLGKSRIENPAVYETEPEASAVDTVLKAAKEHNEEVYLKLKEIAAVDTYRMTRALCDTAARSNAFTFELENVDYKDLCGGTADCLYAGLAAVGKEKKRLPSAGHESTDRVLAEAEDILKSKM